MASFLRIYFSDDNRGFLWGSHLFQRVASFLLTRLGMFFDDETKSFSSLSESGFIPTNEAELVLILKFVGCSHLFQRVASFLLMNLLENVYDNVELFSSLSESGFIPT